MANLDLYNRVRIVPDDAKTPILAGRLKGMTDINPMWRIKKLTEEFGICGIGWKPQIVRTWLDGGANGEVIANVEILLFVRDPQTKEWSDGIPGVGGAHFVSNEKNGLYTDDECYKKAYTDALSVACKAIGMGADVYYQKDSSKYQTNADTETTKPEKKPFDKSPKETEKPLKAEFVPLSDEELVKIGVKNVDGMRDWIFQEYDIGSYGEMTQEQTEECRERIMAQARRRKKD